MDLNGHEQTHSIRPKSCAPAVGLAVTESDCRFHLLRDSTFAGLTPSQVLYDQRQAVPLVREEPYTSANRFRGGERDLRLSNGATDVFLSVLQFALSDLVASQWERALAQWVAWHDQSAAGRVRRRFLREHPGHVLDGWPLPAD